MAKITIEVDLLQVAITATISPGDVLVLCGDTIIAKQPPGQTLPLTGAKVSTLVATDVLRVLEDGPKRALFIADALKLSRSDREGRGILGQLLRKMVKEQQLTASSHPMPFFSIPTSQE